MLTALPLEALVPAAAGIGTAVGTLGGKWFGHRGAVRRIEAGAAARIETSYGKALDRLEARCDDLERDLADSHADRTALHGEVESLRTRVRQDERERRTLAAQFDSLLEHVRVLRTILRSHRIDHPAGPDFLADGGAVA